MGAAKISLRPLQGHDGNTAKKPNDGSVEARMNNDYASTLRLQGGGDKCATGVKTTSDCQQKNQ